ncbi:MAG TPA: hypothetical protein VIL74_07950 [Pyrinomonadaceae bacterium]|jgi:hypothetical protein
MNLPALFTVFTPFLHCVTLGLFSLFGSLLLIAFFFGILFVVGGLGLLITRHFREERITVLHMFGRQNGWTFVPNAGVDVFQHSAAYSIFNQPARDLIALFQRPHDDGTAMFFDYAYTVGHGKNRTTYTQTVVAFHTPRLRLPFFALYPETFFTFIGEMFGYNDIDFATHPVFSKSFKLTGQNETHIRQVFHAQALSFFEAIPRVRVDGGGNYLFVYVHDQTYSPQNLNAFIGMALNIYNLFRR